MTGTEIADRPKVSPATVSRDLEAIHATWGQKFGPAFDMVQELAEAVALYELLAKASMAELLWLEDGRVGSTNAKMKC